jgi:hypothetical protein
MLIGVWSPKGGTGVSTVTAVSALVAAREAPTVVIDPRGDQAAILGIAAPSRGWSDLASATELPVDAINRIAVPCSDLLRLVGVGEVEPPFTIGAPADLLASARYCAPNVFVDLGVVGPNLRGFAEALDTLVVVVRPCYLAVRRALGHPLLGRSVGAVIVEDQGRVLSPRDITATLGCRILATVDLRPDVARAIDSGTLAYRPPEHLVRSARRLLAAVTATTIGRAA